MNEKINSVNKKKFNVQKGSFKLETLAYRYVKTCENPKKLMKDLALCLYENMDESSKKFDYAQNTKFERNSCLDAKTLAHEGREELIKNLYSFTSPNPTEFQKKLFFKVVVEHSFVPDRQAIYPIALIDEWYNNLVTEVNEQCQQKGKPLKINYKNENAAVFSKRLKDALIALNFSFSFIRTEKQRCINGISFRWMDPPSKINRVAPENGLTCSQTEELEKQIEKQKILEKIYGDLEPIMGEWFF